MNQVEDVEIVLAHDRRYKFHAGTLARNSTLLATMLIEPTAVKLSKAAKSAGITTRWMIELKEMPSSQQLAGRLGIVELTPTGERADGRTGMILNENGRVPTKAFDYYESIFYAFYGKEIRICDTDMRAALADVSEMIAIADYLGCVNIISKPVEVALLKHGQNLYRSIQSVPAQWAVMAYEIKSESIFREAMIHLIGNWARLKREAIERVRGYPAVRALVEKHHSIVVTKGRNLEKQVMSSYPGDIAAPSAHLPIKREEYSRDILVWIALTFFRHWLGQRLITAHGHNSEDGGFELYRQLGTAGDAYMEKEVMNQFHTRFPMTKKAMNVVENHLLEIKECIKGIVDKHDILATKCMLDIHKYPVPYLTCIEFVREDFPWLKDQEKGPAMVQGVKRGIRPGGNDIAKLNQEAAMRERDGLEDEDEDEEDEMDEDEARKRVRFE